MSKHQDYVQKTEAIVEPILQKYQFELVDVEFVKEAGNWHLRVYIDKEGGITIDDLTLVNHELSDEMDKDDFIEESYILEVSSPGLLRPFKKPKDFMRNIGEDVEMKLFSPVTWEEKIVAYADMIVSLEGEWFMDVWNDDTCACRAYYDLLSIVFKTRTGRVLTKDHPQFQHEIDFNREMRKYIPREVYETIRPRINRMRDTIRMSGESLPLPSMDSWE